VNPKVLYNIQNGREEIWPSGRNAKNQFGKLRRNKPKTAESRNCCNKTVGGVGVEGMMTLEKVGAHL